MRKTPQDFKRDDIKQLFTKILKQEKVQLSPLRIEIEESFEDSQGSRVSLSIIHCSNGNTTEQKFIEPTAVGFVDGIFRACFKEFSKEHKSLKNIRLVDFQVRPNFNKAKSSLRADACTEVSLKLEVFDHGIAEFSDNSGSILGSSFSATLKAFEFYINCDKAFQKMKLTNIDAAKRNRGDISEKCRYYMSKLTEVNNYYYDEESKN